MSDLRFHRTTSAPFRNPQRAIPPSVTSVGFDPIPIVRAALPKSGTRAFTDSRNPAIENPEPKIQARTNSPS